jgi:hypothetical protein
MCFPSRSLVIALPLRLSLRLRNRQCLPFFQWHSVALGGSHRPPPTTVNFRHRHLADRLQRQIGLLEREPRRRVAHWRSGGWMPLAWKEMREQDEPSVPRLSTTRSVGSAPQRGKDYSLRGVFCIATILQRFPDRAKITIDVSVALPGPPRYVKTFVAFENSNAVDPYIRT